MATWSCSRRASFRATSAPSTLSSIACTGRAPTWSTTRSRRCTCRGTRARTSWPSLIALTRPRHFIPIHGEYRHLSRHVALAIAAGIPEHDCFLLEDGDSLVLSGGEARRGPTVEAGRVMLEGVDSGDPAVVGERRGARARRHGDSGGRALGENRAHRRGSRSSFARPRQRRWNLGAHAPREGGNDAAARPRSAARCMPTILASRKKSCARFGVTSATSWASGRW